MRNVMPVLTILLLGITACGRTPAAAPPSPTAPGTEPGITHQTTPAPTPTAELRSGENNPPQQAAPTPTVEPPPAGDNPPQDATPEPDDAATGPLISAFEITPVEIDPGGTVTLTWQAGGERAQICPRADYTFEGDECRDVPLAGTTTFTIPPDVQGYVTFMLWVWVGDATTMWEGAVAIKCATVWFFADEPGAGICPYNPIQSGAAAQYFERGLMIYVEQIGRTLILSQMPAYEGASETFYGSVYDPLEITADTSGNYTPPEGLYAPESGFGYVWRGDVQGINGYADWLGWALAPEFGYQMTYQCDSSMRQQFCYLTGPGGEVIALHPNGYWYPVTD